MDPSVGRRESVANNMCDQNKFEFVINTNETYIKPNEQFNSFSDQLNSKTIVEDIVSAPTAANAVAAGDRSPPAIVSKTADKFVDFAVKQYRNDGFVCTVDENDRQIYYCYYCHQYISDFDLIAAHIDSAQHLKNILNGISFDKGLDKEFVVETVAEDKTKKKLLKLIDKVLTRMPLHLKHYYFRNGIRLMNVKPPDAYFCKFCNQTIQDYKDIETHLLIESHRLSQQKLRPDLMQLIDKSDDVLLRIGLQFISEDIISDAIVVYECELCNCFDCDNEKMFSHIKSFKHRKNILKEYEYDTQDLSEIDMETHLKEIQEKHGLSCIQTCNKVKRLKTSHESEPKAIPTVEIPLYEVRANDNTETVPNDSTPSEPAEKDNPFTRDDILLVEYESHKIIQTFESDSTDIYFCCYCDLYYNSFKLMRHHVKYDAIHKGLTAKASNCSHGLNDKFLMRPLSEGDDKMREIERLNAIPLVIKHFYYKRGIKYAGNNSYYCRFCQKMIASFDAIDEHMKSESHARIEEKPTKFNDILFQTNQPIIGLKYITEYLCQNSRQALYECTLCDYTTDFSQMYIHLSGFTHQYRALKKIAPNNDIFQTICEKEVSLNSSEMLKKQIIRIEKRIGCGFVKRSYDFDEKMAAKLTQIQTEFETRRQAKIRELRGDDNHTDDTANGLSAEQLLSQLNETFSVRLSNDEELDILISIITSLKDSLFAYYGKPSQPPNTTYSPTDS